MSSLESFLKTQNIVYLEATLLITSSLAFLGKTKSLYLSSGKGKFNKFLDADNNTVYCRIPVVYGNRRTPPENCEYKEHGETHPKVPWPTMAS